jgi:3-hydroxyisobutyrate dehydrogenase-like beta-hydroxyacid dehydrogenase
MATLGFVGLGIMGGHMVKRLLDKGHAVVGFDLVPAKAEWLISAGLRWADSPRAVAHASDIVLASLPNTAALRGATGGPDGIIAGLGPGRVFVDMSTVDADASREIAAQVASVGAVMLDAPVSGSVVTIQRGELSIMVGGPRDAFDRVKPVLLDIGPKVTHVGANGLAVAMKIAVNLSIGVQMQAFCESVLLAERNGIARETAIEVLLSSAVASPMLKYRGPFLLAPPDPVWFNVTMMQKDLNLALAMGQRLNVPLPSAAASNEMLTSARGMGFADAEMSTVFDVLARMAGVTK